MESHLPPINYKRRNVLEKIYLPDSPLPIHTFGTPIDNAVEQAGTIALRANHVALMADHHLGYSMPIGGVAAYDGFVSPTGVGYDIACGNKAVRLSISADHVRRNIEKIMDKIFKEISFGMGRSNSEKVSDDYMKWLDHSAWDIPEVLKLRPLAIEQLGTVGGGNHFVDILIDTKDRVWVANHFGSRGLGHKITTHYMKVGGAVDSMNAPALLFHESDHFGEQYIKAMQLAGEYAYAGRNWVIDKVHSIIGGEIVESIHNHHNFAWNETHEIDGESKRVWVIRKGATPAFPNQRGFVGGSMASNSYIIRGSAEENDLQHAALYSTVHGAGRSLSRSQAKGKFKNGEWKRRPLVNRKEWNDMMVNEGVTLKGADLDESPFCYKDIDSVIESQGNTILVDEILKPIGVAMAGPGLVDPYKD